MNTRSLADLNRINADFWKIETSEFNRRIENPFLLRASLARIESEQRRLVPVYNQITLEAGLGEEESKLVLYARSERSAFARRGGSAKCADKLQQFIEDAVRRRPNVTISELLSELRRAACPSSQIETVTSERIEFEGQSGRTKNAPVSGLKHRLSRARKKLGRPRSR